jgi:hypothetical protein
MAVIEGIRSHSAAQSHSDERALDSRRPLTTKLHLYEALYILNRGFEATLLGLKRLEDLGVFKGESLAAYTVNVELTRAEANSELALTLHEYEEGDSAYWGRLYRAREKEMQDPNDIFLHAEERRQEIEEQIKELQLGLALQHPGKDRPRARKKRRKSAE